MRQCKVSLALGFLGCPFTLVLYPLHNELAVQDHKRIQPALKKTLKAEKQRSNLQGYFYNLGCHSIHIFFIVDDIITFHSEQTATLGFIDEWWPGRCMLCRT